MPWSKKIRKSWRTKRKVFRQPRCSWKLFLSCCRSLRAPRATTRWQNRDTTEIVCITTYSALYKVLLGNYLVLSPLKMLLLSWYTYVAAVSYSAQPILYSAQPILYSQPIVCSAQPVVYSAQLIVYSAQPVHQVSFYILQLCPNHLGKLFLHDGQFSQFITSRLFTHTADRVSNGCQKGPDCFEIFTCKKKKH